VWLTTSPLRIGFPGLYEICDDKDMSVAKCCEDNWEIGFRRMLNAEAYEDWLCLRGMLNQVVLTGDDDKICSGLTHSKCFTTSSLYKLMTYGGIANRMVRIFGNARCL
jgi:hypothetical protein